MIFSFFKVISIDWRNGMFKNRAKKTIPEETAIQGLEFVKYRNLKNSYLKAFLNFVLIAIPIIGVLYVLGVHQRLGLNVYAEQYIGLFLGLILCATFLIIPATKKSSREKVPWYDLFLSAIGLSAGLYIAFFYPDIVLNMGFVSQERFIISVIAIVLILEAIRRILGLALLIIVLLFLSYGFLAPYLPGVLKGSYVPPDQLFNYLYFDPSSMLNLLNIAATIGLVFILFGQILLHFGGGDMLNNIALSLFGRYRGGPAKGSIVGSSLVGSITGSPVTNVLLTGSVTIPLMKKNGYTSTQAGAIEAVASTGGQIMPPVMGIAAFIIAETLGLPYSEIALAALVPALLFYICLFLQVDLIAGRDGISRLSKENIPVFSKIIRTAWMIVAPLAALIYFLFIQGYSPPVAGVYASAVAIIILSFQKKIIKKWLKLFYDIFLDTGRTMIEIGLVLGAAGLVVGVTGITGLGFNIGYILTSVAEHGLLILLIMSAIVSIVLGMGMPAVAAYTLVAVLVAPTIVQFGIDPVAAHLFVFYFAILSNFTPPVAMSCFAAAPIAKESPHKIGFRAMRLGLVAYIVPFLFVYAPEMLLRSDGSVHWTSTTITIVTALIACYFLAIAVEGFFLEKLSTAKRVASVLLAAALFLPHSLWEYSGIVNIFGLVLAVLFLWSEKRKKDNKAILTA